MFEETIQNQNLRNNHRYKFDPLNPVLWHFFGEPFRANNDNRNVYKPVGDFVSDELRRLRRIPSEDPYRTSHTDFSDKSKWQSPLHLGVRIFDYWISEGLHRGIHWHGWLMYFESFVDGILENLKDLGKDVDLAREFPTPYHYLLYEVFSTLGYWIEDAAVLDQKLESVEIDTVDMTHDTIAKSSVITFGRCLRAVLESSSITAEFKAYILEMALGRFGHVVKRQKLKQLYEMAILKGGDKSGEIDEYHAALRQVLPIVDKYHLYMEPGGDLYKLLEQSVQIS